MITLHFLVLEFKQLTQYKALDSRRLQFIQKMLLIDNQIKLHRTLRFSKKDLVNMIVKY